MEQGEQKQSETEINYNEKFNNLPFNGFMKMPLSMLTPIIVDDYKSSETGGAIEIFKDEKRNIYYINDGNHRYFNEKRKIEKLAHENSQKPDLNKTMIEIKKIDPQKTANKYLLDS